MTIRHLYGHSLRSGKLCAGDGCEYKRQEGAAFRCVECPLTVLDRKRVETLPGIILQTAMAEFNDTQLGITKRIEDISCLEFIGMVVIHDEREKWRDVQSDAIARAAKAKR